MPMPGEDCYGRTSSTTDVGPHAFEMCTMGHLVALVCSRCGSGGIPLTWEQARQIAPLRKAGADLQNERARFHVAERTD